MAELENLKRYINDSDDISSTEDADNSSVPEGLSQDDVAKNSLKKSKATKFAELIRNSFLIAGEILIILCIVVKGPFFGHKITTANLKDLFQYDSSTILANLMIRCFVMAIYMQFVVISFLQKSTCRVCGNFFAGRKIIWLKYIDTDCENTTTETTTYYEYSSSTEKVEEETVRHNFKAIMQCKHCGELYEDDISTKSYSRSTSYN